MTNSYTTSVADLTVYVSDGTETWDLNAEGEPLSNASELLVFINELYEQGTVDGATRDALVIEYFHQRFGLTETDLVR